MISAKQLAEAVREWMSWDKGERSRDAVLVEIERLIAEILAQPDVPPSETVQEMRGCMTSVTGHDRTLVKRWADALEAAEKRAAWLEEELSAKLERDNMALLAACKEAMADYQCAHHSDGPHDDCCCWYCKLGKAVAQAQQPETKGVARGD